MDEIESLNKVQCFDAYREEQFSMKIDILLNILDYPGHNKLFHCVGKFIIANSPQMEATASLRLGPPVCS